MSDSSQQTSLLERTGKTVTVWTNATGEKQHKDNASDGYGCVIECKYFDEKEEIQGEIEYDGHPTAHVAKYKAMINGIKYVSEEYSGVSVIHGYTNAKVVADQISGKSDINEPHIQNLKEEVTSLLREFDERHIGWQKRSQSHEMTRAKKLAKDSIKGDSQ